MIYSDMEIMLMNNVLQIFYNWVIYETGSFDTFIFALPAVIVVAPLYWFIHRAWHKRKFGSDFKEKRRQCRLNEIIRLLFVCWSAFVLAFVLMPYDFWMKFWKMAAYGRWEARPNPYCLDWNVKPLFVWLISGEYILSAGEVLHMLENVALFVPFGLALPFVRKRADFLKTLLAGFLSALALELAQIFTGRGGDIDDLICNTLGAVIGYLLYLLIGKLFPRFTEKCKTTVE